MVTGCVLFEVRAELLNISWTSLSVGKVSQVSTQKNLILI
jgi:hypothetical protein